MATSTAPSPIIVPQNENQKVDENGEVIIAEAIFNRSKSNKKIQHGYCIVAMLTGSCFLPCLPIICLLALCLGCIYSSRGASAMRLYLTSSGLHYTDVCLTGCVCGNKFIPFNDIRDVSLQTTKINEMTNFLDLNALIITKNNLDIVEFNFIDNVTDFCAAIKRQKQG